MKAKLFGQVPIGDTGFVGLDQDPMITGALHAANRFEWFEFVIGNTILDPYIRRILEQHGSVAVDVGAYIGDSTATFARIAGIVFAYEPRLDAFNCLQHNMQYFPNVRVFDQALGSHGQFWTVDQDNSEGNPGARKVREAGHDGIPIATLDDLKVYTDRIDFIKIDAEGFEPHILMGGKEIIQKCKPVIFFEADNGHLRDQGFTGRQVLVQFLQCIGYNVRPAKDEGGQDLIAIHKERTE